MLTNKERKELVNAIVALIDDTIFGQSFYTGGNSRTALDLINDTLLESNNVSQDQYDSIHRAIDDVDRKLYDMLDRITLRFAKRIVNATLALNASDAKR